MESGNLVLLEQRDYVARLTLNRPEKLNALSHELLEELSGNFERIRDDDEVRVVILTGTGRAFSAGADLGGPRTKEGRPLDEWWERLQGGLDRQASLRDFPKPIIAAVNGYCLGRGCELALWCDIVIASENARIGEPEIRHGSLVASIIPWLVGPQQAKLVLLTGDTLSAREALEMGLVAKVLPADQLQDEAWRIARRIAKVPPFAVQYGKKLVNAMTDAAGFRQALDYAHKLEVMSRLRVPEAENIHGVRLEQVRREAGMKAFLEARDGPFREE